MNFWRKRRQIIPQDVIKVYIDNLVLFSEEEILGIDDQEDK